MTNSSTTTLTIIKSFEVTMDKVFDAWIDPEILRKWFFTVEATNKVTNVEQKVGGNWEIIDHRGGKDYRAIGKYLEIDLPNKLVLTFEMPQFNDKVDKITVEFKSTDIGCKMRFMQEIVVPHELGWTEEDIEKAQEEHKSQTAQGWNYMFDELRQLLENGKVNYPFHV